MQKSHIQFLYQLKSKRIISSILQTYMYYYIYYSMNSLLWNQKKSLINSRIIDNKNGVCADFEQMVQKQLNDDFKVHQYLSENQSQQCNTHKYMSLMNTFLVQKRKKLDARNALLNKLTKKSHHQFTKTQQSNESLNNKWSNQQNADAYYTQQQYQRIKEQSQLHQQQIELKTREELQMKKILWKQITDKKKSLDLLKGDIGHMITRNQSISVLESKVSKVKLVSENQFKRVSIALSKDKEQIQLRQQMQKKFHNKLKSFGTSENKNLHKAKYSYIDMMNRRKQIFEKLAQIQKQAASIQLYSDKQKQFKQKNIKTLTSLSLLSHLCTIIDYIPAIWSQFKQKRIHHKKFNEILKQEFNSIYISTTENTTKRTFRTTQYYQPKTIFHDINQVQTITLESFLNKIVNQYKKINHQIQQNKKIYNQHIKSLQEFNTLIHKKIKNQYQLLINNLTEDQKQSILQSQVHSEQYANILMKMQKNLRVIYLMIQFINKNTDKQNTIIIDTRSMQYISKLYANFMEHHSNLHTWRNKITKKQQPNNSTQIDIDIYDQISNDLQEWFTNIHKNIKNTKKQDTQLQTLNNNENSNSDRNRKIKNFINQSMQTWKYSTYLQGNRYNMMHNLPSGQNQTPIQQNNSEKQFKLLLQEPNKDISQTIHKQSQYINNINNISNNDQSMSPTKSSTYDKHNPNQAKRVQMLQNIDQRYYKMIKDTLSMEKQNTRKNYQFTKNFKRTKYSTQDQLLQEKRFESTFSSLFKQDHNVLTNNQSILNKTRKNSLQFNNKDNSHGFSTDTLKKSKIKLSETFHTRSYFLLKKCKQNYKQKMMMSYNQRHKNMDKNKNTIHHKLKNKDIQVMSNENCSSRKLKTEKSLQKFHKKLQDIIDLV